MVVSFNCNSGGGGVLWQDVLTCLEIEPEAICMGVGNATHSATTILLISYHLRDKYNVNPSNIRFGG